MMCLDLRARIYDGFVLHKLHIYALPMFERHTDEVMLNMVEISLSITFPDWKEDILAVLTDGARNMTMR